MRALASTAVACALALASGCARPDPPTITPKEAKITAIDPSGMGRPARAWSRETRGMA